MDWLNSPTRNDFGKKQQRVRTVKVRNARKAEERRKGKTRKDGRKGQTRKGGREGQTRKDGRKGQTGKVKFDITEYLKLVFPFQEADADKCFLHFEKVAGNLKWPTDSWVIQLQSVLVGKARKI